MNRDKVLCCLCTMVFVITILLIPCSVLAGSAGVKNGTITGVVYGDKGPLSDVYVVAIREGEPPIIRSVLSRIDGSYTFTNMPLGK